MKWLAILPFLASSSWLLSQVAVIDGSKVYQPIGGFGAASAFAGLVPKATINTEFSPDGLGLKYIRLNVVPDYSDCAAYEPYEGCVKVSSGATLAIYDLENAKAAVQKGAIVWASEWSPPGSMKSNGAYATGGAMIGGSANFSALATAQASFVTLLSDTYHIPVYAISIQNEPNVATNYPSCTWTSTQLHDYLPYLSAALARVGHADTRIVLSEAGHWSKPGAAYDYMGRSMADASTASLVGILAAHGYSPGDPAGWSYPHQSSQLVWQTEISDRERYDGTMTSGLRYAQEIHNSLTKAHVNAWFYWELSGQHYRDNQGLTDSSGLSMSKRAYVIGNWARFATGMSQISSTPNPQPGVYTTAFRNTASGELVIVAINTNQSPIEQTFSLAGLVAASVTPYVTDASSNLRAQAPIELADGSFTARLSGASVTSFFSSGQAQRRGR